MNAKPLAVVAVLPTDCGDVSLTLEGGPVSLALLGVHEEAAGLGNARTASPATGPKSVPRSAA